MATAVASSYEIYETLPTIFTSMRIWLQIGLSLVLKWVIGSQIMLCLGWATPLDLPTYRAGVILVSLTRCIDYCAILVAVNSILHGNDFKVLVHHVVGASPCPRWEVKDFLCFLSKTAPSL